MIIKQSPEDFIVEELFDLDSIRSTDSGNYFYFLLTKTNYAQIRAIEKVARVFNTSPKRIHFAGTKDKVGITKQLISIEGLSKEHFEKSLEYLNDNVDDLELKFLGLGDKRVNLSDNTGNRFIITIRELTSEETSKIKENSKDIDSKGVLNYFDDQRFGFANNSHIVGKYVLQNELEKAVKTILTSLPKEPSENLAVFVEEISKNWNKIKEGDEVIVQIVKLAPKFCSNEVRILEHLKKYKNDFPGAFRTIHKKLRTLYISAYQSYIFNKQLDEIKDLPEKLELINSAIELDEVMKSVLKEDNLTLESFELPSMPEIKPLGDLRETKIYPSNFKILNEEKDVVTVSFELQSGAYATNVVKSLLK